VDGGRTLVGRLWRPALEPAEVDRLAAWFAERASRRAGVGPWFGAAEGANLLMVQAESLQGFVLGLEIGGEEVTPFLNRWAEEALLFSNATDQTAQGRSSDAELLTQVSLRPPPAGAAAFRVAGNHYRPGSALADRGYATTSAVASTARSGIAA
jgi:phosphoglycerol transferase MdoB-like AlkP superfamily enzyme